MRTWLAAGATLAMLLTPLTLSAQDDPRWAEAERRFGVADGLFDAEDYEGALSEYQEVYDLLETHPRRFFALFNIGKCQEHLFRYDEALSSYQRFLTEGRAWARAQGQALERDGEATQLLQALQARLATLQITANVDRAEVWVDNRLVGYAPGAVTVTGGRHVVELRASGRAPSQQDVQIAGRTEQALTFSLDETFSGLSPALFITAAGLTVGAAGVGFAFGGIALGEQSTIDSQLASDDPAERFRVTQARLDANAETALIADIFLATAGVLGIASVVLIFVTDWGGSGSGAESAQVIDVTPWADMNGGGMQLRGRF